MGPSSSSKLSLGHLDGTDLVPWSSGSKRGKKSGSHGEEACHSQCSNEGYALHVSLLSLTSLPPVQIWRPLRRAHGEGRTTFFLLFIVSTTGSGCRPSPALSRPPVVLLLMLLVLLRG